MEKDRFIAGIRNGDSTVVTEIWRDLFPAVSNWAIQGGGDEEDAKDIFQDAMMIIYGKAQCPNFQLTSQFGTFFLGICYNRLGNLFQKKYFKHITLTEDVKYILNEPIDFDESERHQIFDRAKALQCEDCRKVMELYFQKKTMAEIATIMGFGSEQYAKFRKFQCKKRLEELIKQQPGFNELFNKKKL